MSKSSPDNDVQNLLARLELDKGAKREKAILEIREKGITDERIILKLVLLASTDPKDFVREAAKSTLNQPKFREVSEHSPSISEEYKALQQAIAEMQESIAKKLYWPPDQFRKITKWIADKTLKPDEVDKLYWPDQRQRTIEATKSLLISMAKYVGGHPEISQSCEVVVSLTETNFIIYSIDSQYAISVLSSIPLLHIIKVEEQMRDKNNNTFQQTPFLTIEFKLQGYEYAASFESFEKGSSPQDWANKIIAQRHRLRTASSSTEE